MKKFIHLCGGKNQPRKMFALVCLRNTYLIDLNRMRNKFRIRIASHQLLVLELFQNTFTMVKIGLIRCSIPI